MDEKEAVRKIRISLKSGMGKPEVIRRLQNKGYKLEYIDLLMKKAGATRKFFIVFSVIVIVLLALGIAAYAMFFNQSKGIIANPLEGKDIIFGDNENQTSEEVHIDDLEVTPEFLSYLLNEIGAWELHKNPLTFEKPVITFDISGQEFYSVIDGEIETFEGSNEEADMTFKTEKIDLVKAMLDEDPAEVFTESIQEGDTEVDMIASETELFSKGYLNLYDSLKTN
jgi:hypothetical protein